MRVLWLCNVMLPVVAEYLQIEKNIKEGWLTGLCHTVMDHCEENTIDLHVAFPVEKQRDGMRISLPVGKGILKAYGFYEDTTHPERYDTNLEVSLGRIVTEVAPQVIHCFGTEYAHNLALVKGCPYPERILVGVQGVCQVITKAYMADLPKQVQQRNSFRDILKKDGLRQQQEKFRQRGEREREIFKKVHYVAGRTEFDKYYATRENPKVQYQILNETLRDLFYEGCWDSANCEPFTIFMSQGDYPLKGLHYMLTACAKLKETYPKLKLRVAGNSLVGYQSLKEKLKISGYGKYLYNLISEFQLQDSVEFLGKLSAEQMKKQYLSCSVYVCCSTNENSPNSLGEAMLLGVPCVAAKVGGIDSIFVGDQDGILFPGSNFYLQEGDYGYEKTGKTRGLGEISAYLSQAITRIWEDPKTAKIYGENAKMHAQDTHDAIKNYQELLQIYRKIAEDTATL